MPVLQVLRRKTSTTVCSSTATARHYSFATWIRRPVQHHQRQQQQQQQPSPFLPSRAKPERHFISTNQTRQMSSTTSASSAERYGVISPTLKVPEGAEVATYGAGCFWGVEHMYRQHFKDKGLVDCKVGYSGGDMASPDYRSVCGGTTGHAEVLQVSYDPSRVSFADLTRFFFRMHDPTTLNRQGPDRGTQYRSVIFYHSDAQRDTAEAVRDEMQRTYYPHHRIATAIDKAANFWDAERYHQLYLDHNPGGYECPSHFLRTKPMI